MKKKRIHELIKKCQTFLITAHVNPDPDAICSELALADILRSFGKKVYIVNEAFLLKRFDFFPGAKRIKSLSQVKKINYDAAIILDCGDLSRVGQVEQLIDLDKPIINIDHHITNDQFGTINLVDIKASSTAEVIYDLCVYIKGPMNARIATNLYCGIMTDTGSFRFENTTSKTHHVVSNLMKHNVKVSELHKRIYETIPLNDLSAFTKIINCFETYNNGKVVCVQLTEKQVQKISDDFDLRDAIFKFLRSISGVEVIFILSEVTTGETRVNFRSTSYVDVARIAHHFEGGGHKRASGCMVPKNMMGAKKIVLKKIRERL